MILFIYFVLKRHQIDFTIPEGKESEIGCAKLKRKHKKDFVPTFLPAPTANWGPKARATGFKRLGGTDINNLLFLSIEY